MSTSILIGDSRVMLGTLPAASVNCVVTSPPYWGLRDYGTGRWEGGALDCRHRVGNQVQDSKATGAITGGVRPGVDASRCRDCGAARIDNQLGLEPTPVEYVAGMMAVFREVRRVLRDDGTLWLNIGDSYSGSRAGDQGAGGQMANRSVAAARCRVREETQRAPGLRYKNLIGIPWRLAFALQADGWILRQDIIWSKPNPMPESIKDRCTKAHEYLFLLSKSPRYYYDNEAIREPWTCDRDDMRSKGVRTGLAYLGGAFDNSVKDGKPGDGARASGESPEGRNKRSVWTVTTQPFSEAHFATFPPELIEPCILAGCPVGGTVLDPFGGAGTTGLVADRLQRNSILIELNPEYAEMARRRIEADRGSGLLDAMESNTLPAYPHDAIPAPR